MIFDLWAWNLPVDHVCHMQQAICNRRNLATPKPSKTAMKTQSPMPSKLFQSTQSDITTLEKTKGKRCEEGFRLCSAWGKKGPNIFKWRQQHADRDPAIGGQKCDVTPEGCSAALVQACSAC